MSSERQVYALYSVESSSRILLPKVLGQCSCTASSGCAFGIPALILMCQCHQQPSSTGSFACCLSSSCPLYLAMVLQHFCSITSSSCAFSCPNPFEAHINCVCITSSAISAPIGPQLVVFAQNAQLPQQTQARPYPKSLTGEIKTKSTLAQG